MAGFDTACDVCDQPDGEIGTQREIQLIHGAGVEPALPLDLLRALKAQTTNTQPSMSKAESLATDRIADITEMRAQLMLELHAAQDRQKAYYDAQRREVSALLKPGAKAWLKLDGVEFEAIKLKGTKRRKKLNPLYYGPFPIAEQCGPVHWYMFTWF